MSVCATDEHSSKIVILLSNIGCVIQSKWISMSLTNLPLEKNGHHFIDNVFRYIFVNEKFCILTKISPKFAPEGLNDNNQALV